MGIGEIIALVGVLCVAIGLFATWRKNGEAVQEAEMKQAVNLAKFQTAIGKDINQVQTELSSPDHGLVALAKGLGKFETHCAKVSTGLAGKVEENSRDIAELKKTKRGK